MKHIKKSLISRRKKDKYYTFANDHKDKDTHSYRKKKRIHK